MSTSGIQGSGATCSQSTLFQVTVEWQGAEIGYGEGESKSYALAEAIESVDSIYASARTDWTFRVARS
jgi:hypothetical protein